MWGLATVAFKYACENNLHVFAALVLLTCIICYCIHIFQKSQDDNNNKFNWIGGELQEVKVGLAAVKERVTGHTMDIRELKTTTNRLEEKWGKHHNVG